MRKPGGLGHFLDTANGPPPSAGEGVAGRDRPDASQLAAPDSELHGALPQLEKLLHLIGTGEALGYAPKEGIAGDGEIERRVKIGIDQTAPPTCEATPFGDQTLIAPQAWADCSGSKYTP